MAYSRTGFYTVKPGTLDAILTKAEAELIPMNRQQPGFIRYFLIRSGPDAVISTTVWESEEQAEQAAERLSSWVRAEMGPSLVTVENHVGEIPFSSVPSGNVSGYARVSVWRFKPGAADALSERVKDEMLPMLQQRPGFTGYGVARTGAENAIAVSAFATKEQGEAAQATIRDWIQEHAMPVTESVERHEGPILWDARAD